MQKITETNLEITKSVSRIGGKASEIIQNPPRECSALYQTNQSPSTITSVKQAQNIPERLLLTWVKKRSLAGGTTLRPKLQTTLKSSSQS